MKANIKAKKVLWGVLAAILIFVMVFCGGNVWNVSVPEYTSEVYSDREIKAAIRTIKWYFKLHFNDCTLTEITYAGDEESEHEAGFAQRNNADEVIVLVSSFDVGASGGDGSLNPNSTYTGWSWILVRDEGGRWKHVDHGYG